MGTVLFHLFVVLVAAKVAAELAERIGIPAVLGEIVAGIIIGPSVLGVVEPGQILTVLGEIGVILLLLNVGLEMDIGELSRVGRSSLAVAVLGVAAPFAGGTAAAIALGQETKTAIFVGAALTATSVGITARVFGDLKALSLTESRIVLGAAVADDVLGLIILTVVTRIVVDGSVSAGTILSTIGLALGFLLLTGLVGTRLAPPFFQGVQRFASSPATLIAVAVAATLGFSALAEAAHLAPIIGAFMAGLAIGRTKQAHRIEREIAPIGNVFIPVFFLSIGISTDVGAMVKPSVLGIAAVLTSVALVGKLVAALGAAGTRTDKWLIGFGMIPRGEVGLIFAAIGLRNNVLGDDLYAALIVMVLVTTLVTPPLLRWKLRSGQDAVGVETTVVDEPEEGWLTVRNGTVRLNGEPPASLALPLALEAARLVGTYRAGDDVLDWFSARRQQPLAWDRSTTSAFIELLRSGGPRSWRFLETLGVLERALPEVSQALRNRRTDPSELDPLRVLRFPTVDRINETAAPDSHDADFRGEFERLERTEPLLLAALSLDIAELVATDGPVAPQLLGQLSISESDEQEAAALVADSSMFLALLHDPHALDDMVVIQMAAHLGSNERRRRLYLLSVASRDLDVFERAVLDEINARLGAELGDDGGSRLCDARRETAQGLTDDPSVAERIAHAPRSYVLANQPEELVRQARLAEPAPQPGSVRVAVTGDEIAHRWRIDIAAQDHHGLLAHIATAFAEANLDIVHASIATWGDRVVVDSFVVVSEQRPAARALAESIEARLRHPIRPRPVTGAVVRFDNAVLPWHTSCVVEADDSPGLLASIAGAFALAGVEVHSARISTDGASVLDRFALTTRDGEKLDNAAMGRIRRALEGELARRPLRSRR